MNTAKEVRTMQHLPSQISPSLATQLQLDFYRLFHTPLLFIMIVVSAIIPAMVLTMTSANEAPDAQSFTNVWQVVEIVSGGNAGMGIMDMALLCNINMVFIFAAIMVSIFISHDYSSGFVKNIFTVHAKKMEYVTSKSATGFFSGACMILVYFVGAIFAGILSGKSFAVGEANILNLGMCILSKILLMGLFVPLYVTVSVFFKEKLWLALLGAFAVGILFYPVAMMSAPLNATIMNVVLCAAGSVMIGAAFGRISKLILSRRDLT